MATYSALLVVIVLGFLGFSFQLSRRLQQTNRELNYERESSLGRAADFSRYARTAVLVEFVEAWHRGRPADGETVDQGLCRGDRREPCRTLSSGPQAAMRQDRRIPACPPGQRARLDELHSRGALPERWRPAAGRVVLPGLPVTSGPGQKGPWLVLWAKNRLQELTGEGRDAYTPAESEAQKP